MQLDPELEALCDFKLILVPKDAQAQQPAHEHVDAPAASNDRDQQPQETGSTAPKQAPNSCGSSNEPAPVRRSLRPRKQPASASAAASSSKAAPPAPQPEGTGVTAQQPSSEEQGADVAEGSRESKRKLQGETSGTVGVHSEERSSKRPRTEDHHAQAARLPGAAAIPVIRGLLALHSAVLSSFLAECKEQTSMVLPCEDVEAGKQVVRMMMARPATQKAMAPALASSLSVETLIRCAQFAIYLDALVPMELAIDSLCLIPRHLTARDINAMLALPGAIQVQHPELFDKVKGLCSRWLQHVFGDAARLFGSERLKAELCSLELPAMQLFNNCMTSQLREEGVVHALVLWCSHPSHSASLGHEVFMLFSIQDTGTMLSLPPASGARDVCIKCMLHFYKDVHEVVEQQSLRSSFCEHPFDVVCLWAEQDGLSLRHSENEVAVLLELYACAAKLPAAQRKQLGSLLHVSSMSYSFRHFVLPKLSLMRAFGDALTTFNAALDVGGPGGLGACGEEFPSGWVGSRQVLGASSFSFECSFPLEKLASMLASSRSSCHKAFSGPVSFAGFYWKVSVAFSEPLSSHFGVFLVPTASGPIPAPSRVNAFFSLSLMKADGSSTEVYRKFKWFKGERGWGRSRALQHVSSVEQLEEFLLDDKLCIQCNIQEVV